MDLRLDMFQLDSLVVSNLTMSFASSFVEFFISIGLTLGRVVLVEVTKKVILPKSYNSRPDLMSDSQIGTANAIYVYTFFAIS